MKPQELIVRCFAENKDGVWQAVCIDLNLAAQDHTFEGVRRKLDSQIFDYVYDATVGEDREFADQLLRRKAPLPLRVKYYWYSALGKGRNIKDGVHRLFRIPMPLQPKRA